MDHERHRSVGIGHPGREPKAYTILIEELLMMQVLTDMELDAVAGGASIANFNIASLLALGPNNAEVDFDLTIVTETTGGLAPSNTAFVSGTFTATSD
jgi:hypothetical protein